MNHDKQTLKMKKFDSAVNEYLDARERMGFAVLALQEFKTPCLDCISQRSCSFAFDYYNNNETELTCLAMK